MPSYSNYFFFLLSFTNIHIYLFIYNYLYIKIHNIMSIATELQRIKQAKSDIRTNINNLGFNIPDNTLISDFATYIQKTSVPLSMEITVDGDTLILDFQTNSQVGGGGYFFTRDNIGVMVDGVLYIAVLTDGKGQLILPDLSDGEHYVYAELISPIYVADTIEDSFEISDVPSALGIKVEENFVDVTGPADSTGFVVLEISSISYQRTAEMSNGKAYFILNIPSGTYTATVSYDGDSKYAPCVSDPVTIIIE